MSNDNTEQKTKWDLPRFIQALCKRKPEEEAWFKRYLNIGNDRIETKYRNPDYSDSTLKDFVEADEKYLYCGEVKPDLPTVFEGGGMGQADRREGRELDYRHGEQLCTVRGWQGYRTSRVDKPRRHEQGTRRKAERSGNEADAREN